MSTEKSLLTFEEVEHLFKRNKSTGLQIPMGIDTHGKPHVVELVTHRSSAHMLLYGLCGSGKTKAVQFIIKGLSQMYGEDLSISCIDGKSTNIAGYYKIMRSSDRQATPVVMQDCETEEDLSRHLNCLLEELLDKESMRPELIILDDIDHLLRTYPSKYIKVLEQLANIGPRKNTHILYASQTSMDVYFNTIRNTISFDLICATRLSIEDSIKLFGVPIASKEGGTRKYGDITYKYNSQMDRVTVPFCSRHWNAYV